MEHLQTINQVFADKCLRVPDYQRGYAWDATQRSDLLEDLELLEADQLHYTGTLVLHASSERFVDTAGRPLEIYDLVDGQQRLTTLILLLDAIQSAIRGIGGRDVAADAIHNDFIFVTRDDGARHTRLTLNADTREFFRRLLDRKAELEAPENLSQERLRGCRDHFDKYIAKHVAAAEDDGMKWLMELQTKIRASLKLTVYDVPTAADVGVIFEVMNNRGKPLTEVEKTKNYLLFLASKLQRHKPGALVEAINATWSWIFVETMRAGGRSDIEDQLIRSHWIMAQNHDARRWKGSNSIKERFGLKRYGGRPEALIEDALAYVKSLREFSTVFCDMMAPKRSNAFTPWSGAARDAVVRWSEKLHRLDVIAPFIPLLAAVRLRHRDAAAYQRFLELAERYAFRVFRFAERRSNAGQSELFRLGHAVFAGRTDLDTADRDFRRVLLRYAPAKQFKANLDAYGDPDHNWYEWSGIKYFLYEYELELAAGKSVQVPWEEVRKREREDSIEHILPQTPTDPAWTEHWTREQITRATQDIGNLTLSYLRDNISYGNRPFAAKRGKAGEGRCYANSSFFMEREVATYETWTEEDLLRRRKKIVEWAEKRWHVARPDDAQSSPAD